MTAITSGTYGHQPIFSGAIRRMAAALFSPRPAAAKAVPVGAATRSVPADKAWPLPWPSTSMPYSSVDAGVYVREAFSAGARVRQANGVRELARSVELHSPGFAADLYAAASRHEGYDD